MRRWGWLLILPLLGLMGYWGWIKWISLEVPDGGEPLAVRWEGFYHDYNYRDVGTSLNECLGRDLYRPGVLLRSAGWFSGWACDGVGDPEVIFSLNYTPIRKERYFCRRDQQKIIGRHSIPAVHLKDLEFLASWDDPDLRRGACAFFIGILKEIAGGRRVLVHCDAGRDRTGAVSALLAALVAEQRGALNVDLITAIECDYRKTASLDPEKYGRMARFIDQLQQNGGVSVFLQNRCDIPADLSARAGERWWN